jgi:hypothetical protein
MRKPECPVCRREVSKVYIRRGTFPCPYCGEPLRIPRPSRLIGVPIAACGWSLAVLISYLLGLQGNTLLMASVALGVPASFAVAAVMGAVRGYLFPVLERDPGEDSAGILHIVPRTDPSRRQR